MLLAEATVNCPTASEIKEFQDESKSFTLGDILCLAVSPVVLLIGVIAFVLLLVSTGFMRKTSKMALMLKTLEFSQNQQKELLELIGEYIMIDMQFLNAISHTLHGANASNKKNNDMSIHCMKLHVPLS